MNVLVLTIFYSLLLASLFALLFLVQRWHRRGVGVEQEALLPLAEEGQRRVKKTNPTKTSSRSREHE